MARTNREAMRGARRLLGIMASAVVVLTLGALTLVGGTGIGLPNNPAQVTAPPLPEPTLFPSTIPTAAPPATGVFWPDCPTARAAGVTGLHAGDPGYRAGLDRDGDGTACESPPVTTTTTPPAPPPRPLPRLPTMTALPSTIAAPPPTTPLTDPPTEPGTDAPQTTGPAETTTQAPPDTQPPTAPPATIPTPPLFADCNAVVAAGVRVPLHPDDDAWNPVLDTDGDGLACEDDSPTTTTTTTTLVPLVDCLAAWDFGVAPIPQDSPYYRDDWDADHNGVACEDDPRNLGEVTSTTDNNGR